MTLIKYKANLIIIFLIVGCNFFLSINRVWAESICIELPPTHTLELIIDKSTIPKNVLIEKKNYKYFLTNTSDIPVIMNNDHFYYKLYKDRWLFKHKKRPLYKYNDDRSDWELNTNNGKNIKSIQLEDLIPIVSQIVAVEGKFFIDIPDIPDKAFSFPVLINNKKHLIKGHIHHIRIPDSEVKAFIRKYKKGDEYSSCLESYHILSKRNFELTELDYKEP